MNTSLIFEQSLQEELSQGVLLDHGDKNSYTCTVCNCGISGLSQVFGHITGSKHAKNRDKTSENKIDSDINMSDVSTKLYCGTCSIPFNSIVHANQHYIGKSHLKKLRLSENGSDLPKILPSTVSMPSDLYKTAITKPAQPSSNVYCEICKITLCGEIPASQHYSGKSHRKQMMRFNGSSVAVTVQPPVVRIGSLIGDGYATQKVVRLISAIDPVPEFE